MAPLCHDHCLQAPPEALADVPHFGGLQLRPRLRHPVMQYIEIGGSTMTRNTCHPVPHPVVQRVQVWGQRRPHVLPPEPPPQLLLDHLLCRRRRVHRGTILLEDERAGGVVGIHPRLHLPPEDLLVDRGVDLNARLHEDGGPHLAIGGHHAQEHEAGRSNRSSVLMVLSLSYSFLSTPWSLTLVTVTLEAPVCLATLLTFMPVARSAQIATLWSLCALILALILCQMRHRTSLQYSRPRGEKEKSAFFIYKVNSFFKYFGAN